MAPDMHADTRDSGEAALTRWACGQPTPQLVRIACMLLLPGVASCVEDFRSGTTEPVVLVARDVWPAAIVWGNVDTIGVTGMLAGNAALSDARVSWASSDPTVATVTPLVGESAAGSTTRLMALLRGYRPGSVTITAALEQPGLGPGTVSDTVTVQHRWWSITASGSMSCGHGADSIAYCWGNGALGAGLASGVLTNRPLPVVAPGVAFASLSVGNTLVCGLTPSTVLYCWGNALPGEPSVALPSPTVFPTAVLQTVSVGLGYGCGFADVLVTGGVRGWVCWGWNRSGVLGDGSELDRDHPVPISGSPDMRSVTANRFGQHTCGVTVEGKAMCWGANDRGQLGTGASGSHLTPTEVSLPAGVVLDTIVLGREHTCALEGTTAWCWGANDRGQLGDGTTDARVGPVRVFSAGGFVQLSAGSWSTCGLRSDSAVLCWGDNDAGQIGLPPSDPAFHPLPNLVPGGHRFASVSAGFLHTCGVTLRGVGLCWGRNAHGELGDGSELDGSGGGFSTGNPRRVAEPRH